MASGLLSIDGLVSAVGGRVAAGSLSAIFTSVVTDSRQVVPGAMFVPLVGENQDGHRYIPQAIERGATVVLVGTGSNIIWEPFIDNKCCFIEVENTLHALQRAAAAYIDKFSHLVKVGITGSNGKTTTKEMIREVLSRKYRTVATAGNLNSETGVPLSVFSLLDAEYPPEVAVFEMGMNRVGEIAESAAVVRPQYAVITNIGTAHIGIMGSRDAIAREKREILRYADYAFIPYNDDYAEFFMERRKMEPPSLRGRSPKQPRSAIPFGRDDITLVKDMGLDGFDIRIGKRDCHISLAGRHNYMNACAAIELGRALNIDDDLIAEALSSIKPMDGRGASVQITLTSGARVRLVRDYYNANPQSMAAALDVCDNTEVRGKRIYVLGDMKETQAKEAHKELGRRVGQSRANMAVFVGEDVKYAYEAVMSVPSNAAIQPVVECFLGAKRKMSGSLSSGLLKADFAYRNAKPPLEAHFVSGSDDAAMQQVSSIVLASAHDGDLILLKASRSLALERVEALVAGGETTKRAEPPSLRAGLLKADCGEATSSCTEIASQVAQEGRIAMTDTGGAHE